MMASMIKQHHPHHDQHRLLLYSLITFYKQSTHLMILYTVLKQDHISLRLLDWLITNYSKKNNIVYKIEDEDVPNRFMIFNMFVEYKNQLKSFSKRYFDPFCRKERIFYDNNHHVSFINNDEIDSFKQRDDGIVTTLAQLNAFRWFIKYKVLDYAIVHLKMIEKDMFQSLTHVERKINNDDLLLKESSTKKIRKELSQNLLKGYTQCQINVIIAFR